MTIFKIILALLVLAVVGVGAFWLLGFLSSVLSYVFWIALLGGVAYVGYRLFVGVEKALLGDDARGSITDGDIRMTWDDEERKYLHK
jgi:membrane protein implicated in regulation of membrane protease activity